MDGLCFPILEHSLSLSDRALRRNLEHANGKHMRAEDVCMHVKIFGCTNLCILYNTKNRTHITWAHLKFSRTHTSMYTQAGVPGERSKDNARSADAAAPGPKQAKEVKSLSRDVEVGLCWHMRIHGVLVPASCLASRWLSRVTNHLSMLAFFHHK